VSAADVCAAAVEALPVSGAWVMAQGKAGACHIMCATDEVGEQLAELQITLGEGPCLDVHHAAGLRPRPQPAAVRPGPGLHRRHPTDFPGLTTPATTPRPH